MQLDEVPVTPSRLRFIGHRLGLGEAAYGRARELAGLIPDGITWLRHLDRFLLAVGAALIVAGIAAFFAYNWADLHKFAKFAFIETGIVACIVLAWWRGLDSPPGRASLFAAAFFVGVLLAVFGQTYQTGADPYGLFLGWAVLVAGWVLIGRQAGLWLLLLVLANLSLILYWTQVLHPPGGLWDLTRLMGPLVWLGGTVTDPRLASLVFALNVCALIAWEMLAARGIGWMQGRWFPRIVAVIALTTVVIGTFVLIIGYSGREGAWLGWSAPVLFFGFAVASFWYYQQRCQDLFILTACLLGIIIVITAYVGREVGFRVGVALLMATLVIGQTAGAAFWLRGVARRQRVSS